MSHVWGTYSGGAPRWAVCGVLTLVGLLGGPCLCGTYSGATPQ